MLEIIIVQMGFYNHWAIVTDKMFSGKPMLISNSWRNGTVQEESWDQVVGKRAYRVHKIQTTESVGSLLSRARDAINQVKYNLTSYNCEHFVHELVTGKPRSQQVRNALVLIGVSVIAAATLLKKR